MQLDSQMYLFGVLILLVSFLLNLIVVLIVRKSIRNDKMSKMIVMQQSAFRTESASTLDRMRTTARECEEKVEVSTSQAADMVRQISESLKTLSDYQEDLSALQSVCAEYKLALEKLREMPASFEYVAIHDGARPFIESAAIIRTLAAATIAGGAVPVLPVTDAVKRIGVDGMFSESIEKKGLVTVQTPQIFRADEIFDAYDRFPLPEADDDVQVHMWAGYKSTFSIGSPENRKITFSDDIPDAKEQAERYLSEREEGRRSAKASKRMRELMMKGDEE